MHKFSINLILFYLFFSSPFAIVQDSDGLEEIIVTAQRQEQSLQDVPLAVSSFSGDDLLEQQIEGINDMQLFVPGLRFGGYIGEEISHYKIGFDAYSKSQNLLSDSITKLMNISKEERQKMSKRARELAEKTYSREIIVSKYDSLLNKYISK